MLVIFALPTLDIILLIDPFCSYCFSKRYIKRMASANLWFHLPISLFSSSQLAFTRRLALVGVTRSKA